jgi:hypothetical protein
MRTLDSLAARVLRCRAAIRNCAEAVGICDAFALAEWRAAWQAAAAARRQNDQQFKRCGVGR